ncbi:MAG: hypothetical protein GX989_04805 [Firmicutes bacterium]|nr:hypothetical protein [Bacillota bacterium]
MYPSQRALAQEVKQEVIAELQQGNYTSAPPPGSFSNLPYGVQGQWGGYSPYVAADQTYQTIKNSVKNEVLSEIQRQQVDKMAQVYGLDRSLSDQKIQQMIDARYRSIDNLKSDIKKELLALQGMEAQRATDPFIRQTAYTLLEEARRQGIPEEKLMQSLERRTAKGSGMVGWLQEVFNSGHRRGILYAIGMLIFCHLVVPSLRNNMRSVAVRSVEEGMAMVDRAKSFVCSRQQQSPPTDSTDPSPEQPPPDWEQQPPPEG